MRLLHVPIPNDNQLEQSAYISYRFTLHEVSLILHTCTCTCTCTCIPYPLSYLTGASKVDYSNSTSLWIAEENVLRFEVTVDDVDVGSREVEQGGA